MQGLRYDRSTLGTFAHHQKYRDEHTSRSNQHDSVRGITFRLSKSKCFDGEKGIKEFLLAKLLIILYIPWFAKVCRNTNYVSDSLGRELSVTEI